MRLVIVDETDDTLDVFIKSLFPNESSKEREATS